MDSDGCPDKQLTKIDTDMDGITDVSDQCPLEPETYNKFQDEDGCPDSVGGIVFAYSFPDTDGDGIEDRWDSCTGEPENYNGYLLA